MTVSRVLTGSAKVKDATCDRVRKAISLLRYEPNELARELRSRPAKALGLALPRLGESDTMLYADAVQRMAEAQQLPLTLFSFHEVAQQQRSIVSRAAQRGVQRLILVPGTASTTHLLSRDLESMHVVVLGKTVPNVPVDAVTAQDRQGSGLAVKHLLQHDLTHIVFLQGTEESTTVRERLEGYRDAISFANLECQEVSFAEPSELQSTLLALATGAAQDVGIITATFDVTLSLIRALRNMKPALRQRIRFVSLEDGLTADLLAPSVTAIRQPVDEMSSLALNLVLHSIESGNPAATGTVVTVPVELIVRTSCGCKE